jgi:hypothetical protein
MIVGQSGGGSAPQASRGLYHSGPPSGRPRYISRPSADLRENVAAADLVLPADAIAELDSIGR